MTQTGFHPLENRAATSMTPQWRAFVLQIELAVTHALASSGRPYDRDSVAGVIDTGEPLSEAYQTRRHHDGIHLKTLRRLERYAPVCRQVIAAAIRKQAP